MADSQGGTGGATGPRTLREFITSDMVATTTFSMRMVTMLCTFLFILASFGLFSYGTGHSLYLNAMLSAFFTFSVRLYERKQASEVSLFSRQMLDLMTREDSGHYMLYTFFYYNQPPLTIYLIPVFLYAVMLSVKYTQGLVQFLPASMQRPMTQWNIKVVGLQEDIKRFIAYTEIFLMIIITWNTLTGHMFILAPFLHYHFLRLRYTSRRNTCVKKVFSDLRQASEYLANHSKCPPFLNAVISRVVAFLSRLAPPERAD